MQAISKSQGRSWRLTVRLVVDYVYENNRSLTLLLLTILVLCYCLHPARFATHYTYIPLDDINSELEYSYAPRNNACTLGDVTWRGFYPHLLYPDNQKNKDFNAIARGLNVLPGGRWQPSHCQPLFNVAIVLPYRNRQSQLNTFVTYIHSFLQFQNIKYQIFVIEQTSIKPFNRAKLFNIGFVKANTISNFHCFIFQDIDLIPQNFHNIYACTKMPRHMSSSVNTFRYNLPYSSLFGGAIAITREQFQKVNGFSNVFFGWGAEDDDFYSRLKTKGLSVTRFSPDVSQYYMLTHKKELPSSLRFTKLESGSERFDIDGITNLEYNVVDYQLRPLYSWILVDI